MRICGKVTNLYHIPYDAQYFIHSALLHIRMFYPLYSISHMSFVYVFQRYAAMQLTVTRGPVSAASLLAVSVMPALREPTAK